MEAAPAGCRPPARGWRWGASPQPWDQPGRLMNRLRGCQAKVFLSAALILSDASGDGDRMRFWHIGFALNEFRCRMDRCAPATMSRQASSPVEPTNSVVRGRNAENSQNGASKSPPRLRMLTQGVWKGRKPGDTSIRVRVPYTMAAFRSVRVRTSDYHWCK